MKFVEGAVSSRRKYRPSLLVPRRKSRLSWQLLARIAILVVSSSAQVDRTICACSPVAYEWRLNFSRSCEDTTVGGEGVLSADCNTTPFQEEVTNLVPVVVTSIDILELDQDFLVLKKASNFVNLLDGDRFQFISSAVDPAVVNATHIPKALEMSIVAENSAQQPLFMQWLITYSNDCNAFPVVTSGDEIGWTVFVSTAGNSSTRVFVRTVTHSLRPLFSSGEHIATGKRTVLSF